MTLDFRKQIRGTSSSMVEQNTENVWVIGSNPILGKSFDFGEDIKQAALIIHARETSKHDVPYR